VNAKLAPASGEIGRGDSLNGLLDHFLIIAGLILGMIGGS
jgi:hypothetical protein